MHWKRHMTTKLVYHFANRVLKRRLVSTGRDAFLRPPNCYLDPKPVRHAHHTILHGYALDRSAEVIQNLDRGVIYGFYSTPLITVTTLIGQDWCTLVDRQNSLETLLTFWTE